MKLDKVRSLCPAIQGVCSADHQPPPSRMLPVRLTVTNSYPSHKCLRTRWLQGMSCKVEQEAKSGTGLVNMVFTE